MSNKTSKRKRIDNSLTDLTAGLAKSVTGGSQLSGYDTTAFSNNYSLVTLNRIVLTYMYSGNGLFQTAVQLPIQDALAKRVVIDSDELDPDDVDEVMDWLEKHQVWEAIENYWSWVRLYGGGSLIINTDQEPNEPLNMKRLKGAPIEFYDIDRWQMSISNTNTNDWLDYDDMATASTIYINGQAVDKSRCIMGQGKRAPSYIRRQLRGWGMSEAERMLRDLNNYLKTGDVLYEILDESKIDIYQIDGLANKMLTVGGTEAIRKRIQAANEIKNYVNALVLDSKEKFEQKTMTFGGLAEVMKENRIGVASALRMPMAKLFGLSASGFSTGESDIENYNQMVQSEIQAKMRPAIRRVIELACANLWGYVPSFRFEFPPLKELPELDKEQINASKITSLLSLYDRGLITDGTAIGDELAKCEAISAELASKFNASPLPPNGAESVMPTDMSEQNSIAVYKSAKNARK